MGQLILATLLGAIAGTMVMLHLGYSSLWSLLVGAPLGALTGFIGESPKIFFGALYSNAIRFWKATYKLSSEALVSARGAIEEVWFFMTLAAHILLALLVLSPAVAITAFCSQLPYAWFAETPVFALIGEPHLINFSLLPIGIVTTVWGICLQGIFELRRRKQPIAKTIATLTLSVVFLGIAAWPIAIGSTIFLVPYFAFCILRATIVLVATRRNITVAASVIEGLAIGWFVQNPTVGVVASVSLVVIHWSLRDWAERFKAAHWRKQKPVPATA